MDWKLPVCLECSAEAKRSTSSTSASRFRDDRVRVAGFWVGDDVGSRYLRGLNELAS